MNVPEYTDYMIAKQRGKSPVLGPSSAGKICDRQVGFKYFRVPPSDDVSTGMADLGTLLHLGWSSLIRAQYDPTVREPDVVIDTPGMPRAGEADDVDWVNRVVTDLKTVGARVFDGWLARGGPYDNYWDQLQVYGLGLQAKHGGDWSLRIVAICREDGRFTEYVHPFDPVHAAEVVGRIAAAHERVMSVTSVEELERGGRGPGTGFPCDFCQHVSLCWPGSADPDRSPQSESIADDDGEIARWAEEYLDAATLSAAANARKNTALQYLRGLTGSVPLADGSTVSISMVGGKLREVVDADAVVEILTSLGMEVPVKASLTARYPRIKRSA